jgi:hypothetical protein
MGYNWKPKVTNSDISFNIRAELGMAATWKVDVWSHRRRDVTDTENGVGLPYRLQVSGPSSWRI